MDWDFLTQAAGASLILIFIVWFLNPFSHDLRANPLNFLLLFSCSLLSATLLMLGEKEFKIKYTYESFSLLAGVVVLSALLSYGIAGYGSFLLNPYPLLTSAFFLLPIVQRFIQERF
ncbi:MAG: hypothetical protein QXF56_04425 [Candidatus Micrarchaeia archaeon]